MNSVIDQNFGNNDNNNNNQAAANSCSSLAAICCLTGKRNHHKGILMRAICKHLNVSPVEADYLESIYSSDQPTTGIIIFPHPFQVTASNGTHVSVFLVEVSWDDDAAAIRIMSVSRFISLSDLMHQMKSLLTDWMQQSSRNFCEDCNKHFVRKLLLNEHHIRFHTNLRPYKCPVYGCKYRSKTAGDLAYHRKTRHWSAKVYKCRVRGCMFQSGRKQNMMRHKLSHSDVRRVQCTGCGKRFKTPSNANRHFDELHRKQKRKK